MQPHDQHTHDPQPNPPVSLLPYQEDMVRSGKRFHWNCWSRQSGKSFTSALRRIVRGMKRHRTQVFLSASERQSQELMHKAKAHCRALNVAFTYRENYAFGPLQIKQLEIVLPHGVRIIGLPANPHTARGYSGDVLLDEFAMHQHDREIWSAMFPTLLRGDGELDVSSTPRGCNNVFFELAQNPLFTRSTITLPDAIAQGLDANAEVMRSAIGDELLYRQEFLCEFVDQATAFLTYEHIQACCDPHLALHETIADLACEKRDLYVGVDIGRVRDLTAIWVLARANDAFVTVALFELAAQPFTIQQSMISALLGIKYVRRCCIDASGLGMQLAEQSVERFGRHRVEAVRFTTEMKSRLAAGLRLAVEQQRIRIPDDKRIRSDWHSVQKCVTATGYLNITAPRQDNSHADRFWAAALAIRAADNCPKAPEILTCPTSPFAGPGAW